MNLPDAFAVLPQDRTERWERLVAFVSAWHGEVTASDGLPGAELRWAEERLGLSLPLALCEAFENIDSSGRHAKTFMIYYKNDYEIDESAQRLNVPVSEEQERHSAYLDQVTAGVTDEADQLNLTPGSVDAPSRAAGPWLRSLAAKAMLRHEQKRKT